MILFILASFSDENITKNATKHPVAWFPSFSLNFQLSQNEIVLKIFNLVISTAAARCGLACTLGWKLWEPSKSSLIDPLWQWNLSQEQYNQNEDTPWSAQIGIPTLESGIDVGQGINVVPGTFVKKNKRRALNKRRAWTKCAKFCWKLPIILVNIQKPWKKNQNFL